MTRRVSSQSLKRLLCIEDPMIAGLVRGYFGKHVYHSEKRLRGSANKSEADEMQNRAIQNDVGCMNTSSPSCMAVKSLLAAATLPFLECSALQELLGLSRPSYF